AMVRPLTRIVVFLRCRARKSGAGGSTHCVFSWASPSSRLISASNLFSSASMSMSNGWVLMVSPSLGNALDVFFAAPLDANLSQTHCFGLRLHRRPLRHVFGDAPPRVFDLRRDLGIRLAALRELLPLELQQREAFLLDAELELVLLLGDVL